jgi:hypothetical protein
MDIPALIERLRHAAHVSMVSADNKDYYCGVTIGDALAAADALTALSASHAEQKALADIYGNAVAEWRPVVERAEAAEAQVAALTAEIAALRARRHPNGECPAS